MTERSKTTPSPIKQAAIVRDGIIWTLPRPARHHNIIWAMNDVDGNIHTSRVQQIVPARGAQGFVDEGGQFLSRVDAAIRAEQCGQTKKPLTAPPALYSEDLW